MSQICLIYLVHINYKLIHNWTKVFLLIAPYFHTCREKSLEVTGLSEKYQIICGPGLPHWQCLQSQERPHPVIVPSASLEQELLWEPILALRRKRPASHKLCLLLYILPPNSLGNLEMLLKYGKRKSAKRHFKTLMEFSWGIKSIGRKENTGILTFHTSAYWALLFS